MLKKYLIAMGIALSLSACTTIQNFTHTHKERNLNTPAIHTAKQHYHATNPSLIRLTDKKSIKKPYKIIGNVKINHANLVGIKRQQAIIDDLMQKKAANIGGNAIIDIKKFAQYDMGKIIRFTT